MASARLNVFQNFPFNEAASGNIHATRGVHFWRYYVPGSISFNTVAFLYSHSANVTNGWTVSFGLYSLNGSTLSLANSASASLSTFAAGISWLTMVTSAAQDITPGDWWFAVVQSHSTAASFVSFIIDNTGGAISAAAHGGPFHHGLYSTSNGVPSSVATNDANLLKDGGKNSVHTHRFPYMFIAA